VIARVMAQQHLFYHRKVQNAGAVPYAFPLFLFLMLNNIPAYATVDKSFLSPVEETRIFRSLNYDLYKEDCMSLIHVLVTNLRGYDMYTLYFDDREDEGNGTEDSFINFEKEFVSNKGFFSSHPEDTFGQTYFGYFRFPYFSADEIYNLYRIKCESKPELANRYKIYFTRQYEHLEEMIKRFDRPLKSIIDEKHKFKTYSHRLEYFERSIQILRDMQTAIYETQTNIAEIELDFHNKFLKHIKK
jgi:hypothetical protein